MAPPVPELEEFESKLFDLAKEVKFRDQPKSNFQRKLAVNALCGYPLVKTGIRDSNQISTTAPMFLQFNYFRQNLEEKSLSLSIFISFASNFLCKIL